MAPLSTVEDSSSLSSEAQTFSNDNSNQNTKKQVATRQEYGGNDDNLIYKSGIPTLRSSAHRVKFDVKRRRHDPKPKDRNGKETNCTWLPPPLLREYVFDYDTQSFDLKGAVIRLLESCNVDIIGTFESSSDNNKETILEDFRVPVPSVWRSVNGGCCENAQKCLSDAVASHHEFMDVFDRFVTEVTLPSLKQRLVDSGATVDSEPVTFYYQRPPTIRLQPGPGWAKVKPHNDAEYGHQNGELNFWVPLTDRMLTGVDLWSETTFQSDDYHPIQANIGQVISFHGSSCRHYVNANATNNTRVSLDFRIGVQGYFDPYWQMKGTTDDHGRREVTI